MSIDYQVIVVGAGHAGCEAALAASRCGVKTLLLTMSLDTVASMPCNPSIGGQGKAQLVREIDAMGGAMGLVADLTRVQARMLNTRKGFAVQAIRVQSDKKLYSREMLKIVNSQPGLDVLQGVVNELIAENGKVAGVITALGDRINSAAVVLCTGTFLRGLIHIGRASFPAGRAGEPPSTALGEYLYESGAPLVRFKTGTPPRVRRDSIDFSGLEVQEDIPSTPLFSIISEDKPLSNPECCYLTHTNDATHDVIRENMHESALMSGRISGIGPRYCPSIEDKIARFSHKPSHKVFLEPEGFSSDEIYLQGVSTSLPESVQSELIRTLPGLHNAWITRPGYAVEYDIINPEHLFPTMMSKEIQNLFLAGQINGSSGYEEAAAQGVLAGCNAAATVMGRPQTILPSDSSFLGLMIDEITRSGIVEPYRIFTSTSPRRLHLRMSNAEKRLTEAAFASGLIPSERQTAILERESLLNSFETAVHRVQLSPEDLSTSLLQSMSRSPVGRVSLSTLVHQPEFHLHDFSTRLSEWQKLDRLGWMEVETRIKYRGYLQQEQKEFELREKSKGVVIPEPFFDSLPPGISSEARQKILAVRPSTLGDLAKIPGVRASDFAVIMMRLRRSDPETQEGKNGTE